MLERTDPDTYADGSGLGATAILKERCEGIEEIEVEIGISYAGRKSITEEGKILNVVGLELGANVHPIDAVFGLGLSLSVTLHQKPEFEPYGSCNAFPILVGLGPEPHL